VTVAAPAGCADLAGELAAGLRAGTVITDPDVLAGYSRDQLMAGEAGRPAAAVLARSRAEVQHVLATASRYRIPVVPQGARSGLAGAANAVEGCILLGLHQMNAILDIDPANRLAVVEPGVVNAELSAAAAAHGLYYPPDPASRRMSTLGGNIATNAGGLCCVKYGVTREYVLGLEVVLASGEVLVTGRRTVKGVAGYDLTGLLVGSEGTLAVTTQATLALRPVVDAPLTIVATFASVPDAGAAIAAIVAGGQVPAMLELIDRVHIRAIEAYRPMGLDTDAALMLLAQADTGERACADLRELAATCREFGATEIAEASDAAESDMLLEARRIAYTALEHTGRVIVEDVCVPRSRLAEFLCATEAIAAASDLVIGILGHAGDGNIHPNIVVPHDDPAALARALLAFDQIMGLALTMGGTITGEHGVGSLKRGWLAREIGPLGLSLHRGIKAIFDPDNILNPGKVFAPAGWPGPSFQQQARLA